MPEPIQMIPSKHLAKIKRKKFDIPYASISPAQKLDVYLPEKSEGPFPVIVSIHGGAFMFGDKRDMQTLPMLEGLNRGYAVVSINYRMSGEAKFPALVYDMKAAIRWIRAESEKLMFDPNKIAVWGGSAGGYLAAMAGVSPGIPKLEDLSLGNPDQGSSVQAVIDWFGPTNFLKMDEQINAAGFAPVPDLAHNGERSPESLLMGAKITLIPEQVKAANPETYINASAPPFLIQHGTNDDIVPYLQSVYFAEKLAAVLGSERATIDLFEGAQHGDPQFGSPENLERVFVFLDKYLM